jgi:hypothetical protein
MKIDRSGAGFLIVSSYSALPLVKLPNPPRKKRLLLLGEK